MHDLNWLDNGFIKKVQGSGAEIIQASDRSSLTSAANAICDHVRDLWLGTPEGEVSSMGVISDGNPYGVKDDLIFSFPCKIAKGGNY